jgi:hypothetical protein
MKRISNANRIADQIKWMECCGGSLSGYVAHYGAASDPDHYGDGGEAIYAADLAALRNLTGHLEPPR